jgi:ribosome-associated translation inhibitor RaiA
MVNLDTTNWLLGVIAVASAVQMLMLVGGAIVGYKLYRQTMEAVTEVETRHIAPLRQQVDAILVDVQRITARVSERTERVDDAISETIDRVDETAERMKHRVREKVWRATGFVRGVRAVVASMLTADTTHKPPAQASGRI